MKESSENCSNHLGSLHEIIKKPDSYEENETSLGDFVLLGDLSLSRTMMGPVAPPIDHEQQLDPDVWP